MTSDIVLPKAEIKGEGTLTYRCAGCGELILDGAVAWTDGYPDDIRPDTKTWHMEHAPTEGNDGG